MLLVSVFNIWEKNSIIHQKTGNNAVIIPLVLKFLAGKSMFKLKCKHSKTESV